MEEKDRLQDPLEELNYDLEQKSTRSAIAVQQLTTSTFGIYFTHLQNYWGI